MGDMATEDWGVMIPFGRYEQMDVRRIAIPAAFLLAGMAVADAMV
jgi:hypothetical protein